MGKLNSTRDWRQYGCFSLHLTSFAKNGEPLLEMGVLCIMTNFWVMRAFFFFSLFFIVFCLNRKKLFIVKE